MYRQLFALSSLIISLNACGADASVEITPAQDTTAPLLSNIAADAVTDASALISWATDEVAISDVEYGTSAAYGDATALYGLETSHRVVLSSLASGTLYHFRVKSRDAAGNLAT